MPVGRLVVAIASQKAKLQERAQVLADRSYKGGCLDGARVLTEGVLAESSTLSHPWQTHVDWQKWVNVILDSFKLIDD